MTTVLTKIEYICLSSLCLLLVGVPLLWITPENINPDTYIYLSIANYYLLDPSPTIHDAFTVGPVIPMVLAAFKYTISLFVRWTPDYDFSLVKLLAFSCYLVIITYMYKIVRADCSKQVSILITLFFLCLMPSGDLLSLNGELACVAMFAVLHYSLQDIHKGVGKLMVLAALSAVIFGTKTQAIPLIFLIIFSEERNKRDLIVLLLCLAVAAASLEMVLYNNGTGAVKNIHAIIKYIGLSQKVSDVPQHYGNIGKLYQFCVDRFPHVRWVLKNIFRYFPVYYILIAFLIITVRKQSKSQISSWIIWLCVTIFTIWLPGFKFGHYVIFAIPFIWKFAGPVYSGIENSLFKWEFAVPIDSGKVNCPYGYIRKNYSIIIAVLITLILIVIRMNPNVRKAPISSQTTGSGIYAKFTLGAEMAEVRDLINRSPGSVLVHGFDYKCFVYLNTYNRFNNDLPTLMFGMNDEATYTKTLLKNNFDYIIDIVNYCGLMREPKYSLSNHKTWGAVIAQSHDLVYNKGGLLLFKKKPS